MAPIRRLQAAFAALSPQWFANRHRATALAAAPEEGVPAPESRRERGSR
jgi:hypothetical protein